MKRVLALIGMVAALVVGGIAAYASTNATQTITLTVPAAVSLTSNGDVAFGTVAGLTSKTGSFAITSNDANGFQLAVSTTTATYLEVGGAGCTPTHSISASAIQVGAAPVTGQTSGTAGTAIAPFALSTTNTNVFSTVPTAQGTAISETVTYTVNGSAVPANSGTCTYSVPTNWVIGAQ